MYEKGHTVVGVDAVAKGIEDFFQESALSYRAYEVPGVKGTVYKVLEGQDDVLLKLLKQYGDIIIQSSHGIKITDTILSPNAYET